jgi:hypothetical protein
MTLCAGACIDTNSDGKNCGATGLTLCGNSCVNLTTDAKNCGACGKTCPTGQSCVNSACVTAP